MPVKREKITLLFLDIQNGNPLALDQLFFSYYPALVSFAKQYVENAQEAEEITSEFFVRIWLKRSTLSQVINPEVYMYVSIKNACLNLIRSGKRKRVVFAATTEEVLDLPIEHTDPLLDQELVKLLDQAIELLPEQRRIIFKLIKQDGLKSTAAAKILGLSIRTVENQLYQAVKTLAGAISGYLGYHPQKKISRKQALSEIPVLFFL